MSNYFLLDQAPDVTIPPKKALDKLRCVVTKSYVDAEVCRRLGVEKSSARKLAGLTGLDKETAFHDQYHDPAKPENKKKPSPFNKRCAQLCESHLDPKKRIEGTVETWEHGPDGSLLWDVVNVASYSDAEQTFQKLLALAAKYSPSRAGLAAYAALGPNRLEWNDPVAFASNQPVVLSPGIVELLASDSFWLALSLLIAKVKMNHYRAPVDPHDLRRRYTAGLIYDLLATQRSAYKIEQYGLTRDALTDLLGWPPVATVSHRRFGLHAVEDALEREIAAQGQEGRKITSGSSETHFWSRAEAIEKCPNGPELSARLKELGIRYRLDEQWKIQLHGLASLGAALLRHAPRPTAHPEQSTANT